jgi:uncharacterized protein YjiS (DUF1127 family)
MAALRIRVLCNCSIGLSMVPRALTRTGASLMRADEEVENMMAYANETYAASGTLFQRIATFRAGLADRAAKYRLYRRTQDELAMLSDRDLADLGIARGMINDIASQAAYGK